MQNYRVIKDEEEILKHLEGAREKKVPFTIWQNINDRRTISTGHIRTIDPQEKFIVLDSNDQIHVSFQKDVNIYLKISYGDIIFKGKIRYNLKNMLAVELPTEIQMMEMRTKSRRKMRLSSKNIFLLAAPHPLQARPVRLKLPVLDLSMDGASLLADSEEIESLKSGSRVLILQMGGKTMDKEFWAQIVYILPLTLSLKIKNLDSYRIGVKLEHPISEDFFHHFEA